MPFLRRASVPLCGRYGARRDGPHVCAAWRTDHSEGEASRHVIDPETFGDVLRSINAYSGDQNAVWKIPAFHTSLRPLSENTINQAFRRMGFAVGEITAHGLRTTASTLLNENGKWTPDAIERSLAHADADSVRGTYNRGAYSQERIAMHQWWSDHLDQLRQKVTLSVCA